MKLEEKLVCFLKFPRPVLVKIAHLRNKNSYLYSVPKYDIPASSHAMIQELSQKEQYF